MELNKTFFEGNNIVLVTDQAGEEDGNYLRKSLQETLQWLVNEISKKRGFSRKPEIHTVLERITAEDGTTVHYKYVSSFVFPEATSEADTKADFSFLAAFLVMYTQMTGM